MQVPMKLGTKLKIKPEKAVGFAAVLLLHLLGLYGLWSYQIIPPPEEALIVFAHFINPPAAATRAEPALPKPARQVRQVKPAQAAKPVKPAEPVPVRPKTTRQVAPVSEHLLVSAAPITSPAQSVAAPPPAAAAPAPVAAAPASKPGSQSGDGTGAKPVLLTGQLSVVCSERSAPVYPQLSIRRNEQGKTILLVELDEFGRVVNVAIKKKSGFPRLDEAAVSAVKTWRCTPAKLNGAAVHSLALQPFNFALKGP